MRNTITYIIFALLITTGCRNNYFTKDDYQSVLKIDSHAHIDTDKGFFEEQAIKDNFRLLTINVDHSDSAEIALQHEIALNSLKRYKGTVYYAATFYFDTAGFGTENWSKKVISHLENDIAGGAVSVKIWKNIGMKERDKNGRFIMVDDPALDPVINFIISRNLPITGHLGEPRNCWLPLNEMTVSGDSGYFAENPQYHMFLHPEYPTYEDQINARDNLLAKHPDLIFVGCHLGSLEWNVDELAKRLDKFPNMAVDMAARICHLQYQSARDRKKVRDFCIKYQDRLLYGTDRSLDRTNNPASTKKGIHDSWIRQWRFFVTDEKFTAPEIGGEYKGLKLPAEVIDKIFLKNAEKWLPGI